MGSSISSTLAAKYPYPSTLNVANFVSIKLSKDNYPLWKTQMLCLIESQDLLGFIDGTLDAGAGTSQDYPSWRISDRLLKGWILGSLTEDVLAAVVDLHTAGDVWTELEKTFGPDSHDDHRVEEGFCNNMHATRGEDLNRYLPLYKAALRGDWERAERFFDQDKDSVTANITRFSETALTIAVGTGNAIHFVENLVELMPKEALSLKNIDGDTALVIAAVVDNTDAATILVNKSPDLLYICGNSGRLPIHAAAQQANEDTLSYLMRVTKDDVVPSPFEGHSGALLLRYLIESGFIGMALNLIKRYPHLAIPMQDSNVSPLIAIAQKASAFPSGSRFNILESFIYSGVPVKLDNYPNSANGGDIENPASNYEVLRQTTEMIPSARRNYFIYASRRLNVALWDVAGLFVPRIKHIRQKKKTYHQAIELVKCFCEEIKSSDDENGYKCDELVKAVHLATSLGIHEVVEEIVDIFPDTIWENDRNNHSIFQLAVIYRCEKVFNLIYQMNEQKRYMTWLTDYSENNILHLAGRLAPPHKLNIVSGAALQMQRELQWFKEVEKFVYYGDKEHKNSSNETPAMVFSKEHRNLVIEGEKWMKDTASSCSIAATLITTVVFAATFTVPGGNDGNSGLPIFSNNNAFIIFVVSDAISLFTSTTSLLMFLSILTARYAEEDFLYVLPKRLILGLVALFISITSMMITFCATLYLVFGQKQEWTIIPVAALACLPVTSFVTLQFPLLVALISSTFGRGIFGKQRDRAFY